MDNWSMPESCIRGIVTSLRCRDFPSVLFCRAVECVLLPSGPVRRMAGSFPPAWTSYGFLANGYGDEKQLRPALWGRRYPPRRFSSLWLVFSAGPAVGRGPLRNSSRRNARDYSSESPPSRHPRAFPRAPVTERVLILGLVVLPIIGFAVAKVTHGPFVWRYFF